MMQCYRYELFTFLLLGFVSGLILIFTLSIPADKDTSSTGSACFEQNLVHHFGGLFAALG